MTHSIFALAGTSSSPGTFSERTIQDKKIYSAEVPFDRQSDAETTARLFMIQLMNGVSTGGYPEISSFQFKQHEGLDLGTLPESGRGPRVRALAARAAQEISEALRAPGRDYKPDYVVIDGPIIETEAGWFDSTAHQVRARWLARNGIYTAELSVWAPSNTPIKESPFNSLIEGMQTHFVPSSS